MLSMKQVICEMKASVARLEVCRSEGRFSDMPYLLGGLLGYDKLLLEFVIQRICESKEVKNEDVPEMSQDDDG